MDDRRRLAEIVRAAAAAASRRARGLDTEDHPGAREADSGQRMVERRRAAVARRHRRTGAERDGHHLGSSGQGKPTDQRDEQRRGRPAARTPDGRRAPAAGPDARGGRARARHRMRERGEPAARSRHRAKPGVRHSVCARGRTRTTGPTARHREPVAVGHRRWRRPRACALDAPRDRRDCARRSSAAAGSGHRWAGDAVCGRVDHCDGGRIWIDSGASVLKTGPRCSPRASARLGARIAAPRAGGGRGRYRSGAARWRRAPRQELRPAPRGGSGVFVPGRSDGAAVRVGSTWQSRPPANLLQIDARPAAGRFRAWTPPARCRRCPSRCRTSTSGACST